MMIMRPRRWMPARHGRSPGSASGARRRGGDPRPRGAQRGVAIATVTVVAAAALPPASIPGTAARASVRAIQATGSPNVLHARERTVAVAWGRIGYRALGSGPPLVLLIGGGGPSVSIDDWPPSLTDALARGRRVLMPDYEGIGKTSARPGPISIPRLADDTADFIKALHLKRPDVLGWSMGGFVAQALAIVHPGLLRRIVLCASAPGDGTAVPPKVSGTQRYPAQWLFPFDRRNHERAIAYERSVRRFPNYYEGPTSVAAAEGIANYLWTHGQVPIGHRLAHTHIAALVADGTQDVLDPFPDSRRLAQLLHTRPIAYRDAGHGFLIQHATASAVVRSPVGR